jgi:geranyl-CoA carboxylase alpha subunit
MTAPNPATPFHKILIANRGEIALRVIRSARRLGYRTVAVYSTADARARHVSEADQAVCIGEPLPAQSYLHIAAIIDAARLSGADAVHPGYGFLAENEDFAQACADAGLVFIGPSAQAIAAMGHKAGAKTLMSQAGVPCIPGYQGADQSDERLSAEAARIGYPVMIKATAGGGGRGMRLVHAAGDFAEALRSARSEAQSAFGSPEVILERAIVEPRHIEIQVFADRHGNAVHMGERDCSVQRRHQKVIEEAPSPAVSPELRARMGATAVAAVKAIRYEGAGTLEFLLDRDGQFHFMEMNTRLQVEHPVTEAITGLDLVEWQLRVAAGEALPLAQDDIRFSGHAIEVRLCAEDPDQGFMPQSGGVALWRMPSSLRVEDALCSGADVPPYYDSMVAKLIAHGRTRDEARRKLMSGLEDAVALGVTTNQRFLHRCLAHPVFAAGGATTAFIGRHLDALLATDPAAQARAAAVAAVLLYATGAGCEGQGALARRLVPALPLAQRLEIDGRGVDVGLTVVGRQRFELRLGGQTFTIEMVAETAAEMPVAADPRAHHARLVCDGLFERADFHRDGALLLLHYRGQSLRVIDKTRAASARQGEAGGDGKLRASMNGRVVAVLAEVGQPVQAGQPIVTLEAMKMEHVHVAPVAGTLAALHVKVGEQVGAHRIVAEIAADSAVAPSSAA